MGATQATVPGHNNMRRIVGVAMQSVTVGTYTTQ